MKTSPIGITAIQSREGLRLFAYLDDAGVPTIGYGHTKGVFLGQKIDEPTAVRYLEEDLAWAEEAVNSNVKVPLTENQFDALVSFVFNVGAGGFATSTLLEVLNQGNYTEAAEQLLRWNKVTVKGELVKHEGLVNRRNAEKAQFLSGVTKQPPVSAPAPRPDQEPYVQSEAKMPIPAIITALAPAFLEMVPKLGAWFGSGSKSSERNIAVVGAALELAQKTAGAVNALDVVEKMKADPTVRESVNTAIEANWYGLTEAGGGGIEGARNADLASMGAGGPWWQLARSPSFVVACLLLPMVYLILGNVTGLYGADWSADARAGISGSIASGIVMGLIGYYYGQTTSRNRTPA